jgi:hypothetical protein
LAVFDLESLPNDRKATVGRFAALVYRMELKVLRRQPFSRPTVMTPAVIVLSVLFTIPVSYTTVRLDRSIEMVLLGSLAAVLCLPLLWRATHGGLDPFEPLAVFSLAYGVMFVIRPYSELREGNDSIRYWGVYIDLEPVMGRMIGLALLGAVGFVIGYHLPLAARLAKRLPNPPKDFHVDTVALAALGTGSLGLVLFGTFLLSTGATLFTNFRDPEQLALFTGSSGYLYTGFYFLIPSALILIVVGDQRKKRAVLLLGVIFAVLFLLIALPTGNRLPLLPFASGLLIYRYARRGTRPNMLLLLLLAVSAVILSSIVVHLRAPELRGDSTPERTVINVVSRPAAWFDPLTRGADNSMSVMLAAALTVVPEELPYQMGRDTFGDLLFRPIPRSIWPEKPVTPNQRMVSKLWPEAYEANAANPEFSVVLSFYRDFGPIGVLLGLGVFGSLARTLYEYYLHNRDSMAAMLLLGVGLGFMVLGVRDNPVDTLWRWFPMMLPIWIIFHLAPRRNQLRKNERQGPGSQEAFSTIVGRSNHAE